LVVSVEEVADVAGEARTKGDGDIAERSNYRGGSEKGAKEVGGKHIGEDMANVQVGES